MSEAVRGEGAHLVDASGTRFMLGQHELAELAPRDIVAKAITRQMELHGTGHMYLDARHFGAEMWEQRFPTILAACRAHGIDPITEPIPVAPAAHYASGGIRTDLRGRTTVPGLYACGEVACTGVHGANRLASNSSWRASSSPSASRRTSSRSGPARAPPKPHDHRAPSPLIAPEARSTIQRIMTRGAGVLRSAESLATAADELEALHNSAALAVEADEPKVAVPGVEAWEVTNLLLVSRVLVAAARQREETRGCHWREDRPERDDENWRRHLVVRLTPERRPVLRRTETEAFGPVGPAQAPDCAAAPPPTPPTSPRSRNREHARRESAPHTRGRTAGPDRRARTVRGRLRGRLRLRRGLRARRAGVRPRPGPRPAPRRRGPGPGPGRGRRARRHRGGPGRRGGRHHRRDRRRGRRGHR